ncbi:MAG: hypothetical protein ACK5WP_03470 [Neisseriaceae bacterium]
MNNIGASGIILRKTRVAKETQVEPIEGAKVKTINETIKCNIIDYVNNNGDNHETNINIEFLYDDITYIIDTRDPITHSTFDKYKNINKWCLVYSSEKENKKFYIMYKINTLETIYEHNNEVQNPKTSNPISIENDIIFLDDKYINYKKSRDYHNKSKSDFVYFGEEPPLIAIIKKKETKNFLSINNMQTKKYFNVLATTLISIGCLSALGVNYLNYKLPLNDDNKRETYIAALLKSVRDEGITEEKLLEAHDKLDAAIIQYHNAYFENIYIPTNILSGAAILMGLLIFYITSRYLR